MTTKEYFLRPETNNSDLNLFSLIGAERFMWEKKKREDDYYTKDKVKYLRRGEGAHCKILEPQVFERDYVPIDVKTPTSPQQKGFCVDYVNLTTGNVDKNEAMAQAYLNNYAEKDISKATKKAIELEESLSNYIEFLKLEDSEHILISTKDHTDFISLKERLAEDDVISELLWFDDKNIFTEHGILWKTEWSNVGLKIKPDRIKVDHKNKVITNIELKSTKNASKRAFINDIWKYKYYKQEDFYEHGIRYWAYEQYGEPYKVETKILAFELEEPYCYNVFTLDESMLNAGRKIWEKQLTEYTWHYESGIWLDKDYYENKHILVKDEKQLKTEEEDVEETEVQ